MAKLRFVTISMWIQLFSWSCSETIIKNPGVIKYDRLILPVEVVPVWKLCLFQTLVWRRHAQTLSPCIGSSTGLWHYLECVKLGLSGVLTALLPRFGESIASCNGKLHSRFFNCTRGNATKCLWSSVARHLFQGYFLNMITNTFLNFRETTCKHLACKSELLKSCAVKSFTYDW